MRVILSEECGVAMQSDLAGKVLKDVSRSFYLSLRFLPSGFRAPASLGYLLARLSDTIADAGGACVEVRKSLLEEFRKSLRSGDREWLTGLSELSEVSEGEERLIQRAGDCFEALDELPDWQQTAVKKVVGIITEGQGWDLTRFDGGGVVRLKRDAELLTYTYQVAGCVGEFWTELGFGCEEDFSPIPEATMNLWGRSYGQSLQLINILRDVAEDFENGRCYLPGIGEVTPKRLMKERARWIEEARGGLENAMSYAESLNGKRMRFATVLPAMIGCRTLDLLEKATWEEWQARVKVSRSEVRGMMRKAAKFSVWD